FPTRHSSRRSVEAMSTHAEASFPGSTPRSTSASATARDSDLIADGPSVPGPRLPIAAETTSIANRPGARPSISCPGSVVAPSITATWLGVVTTASSHRAGSPYLPARKLSAISIKRVVVEWHHQLPAVDHELLAGHLPQPDHRAGGARNILGAGPSLAGCGVDQARGELPMGWLILLQGLGHHRPGCDGIDAYVAASEREGKRDHQAEQPSFRRRVAGHAVAAQGIDRREQRYGVIACSRFL